MSSTVKLAEYLFTRLRQIGIGSIHGVPGDYNLELLDFVEPQGIHWVGNCNELNAGYAADGYARIKGAGALITTFGVGELSAANAIAGAYAELAPVIHIVGTPSRQLQESRALVHHTLNDGDYRRFSQMAKHITVAQANLWDPRLSPSQIDQTIQQCLIHSRPVYIEVPADMVSVLVPAERLSSKIEIPEPLISGDEAAASKLVLEQIYASKSPMILVDGESQAYGALDVINKIIKATQWPTWTSVFAKSYIDETLPNVHGIWKGDWATEEDRKFVESRDLILCFGPHFSSTNTYAFTSIPNPASTILFMSTIIKAGNQTFRDLPITQFLSKILQGLDVSRIAQSSYTSNDSSSTVPALSATDLVTQKHFYATLSSFLQPGDIILGETGTAGHGCRDFKLPPDTVLFKPSTWLSIGYMLPASQGAALAQRELSAQGKWPQSSSQRPPRTILLIGDGSFQMTAQELSIIIREKLNVVIFLINNSGYTIERCIHGWDRQYNDVAFWRYLQAPSFFGASEDKSAGYYAKTQLVKTWGELHKVLEDESHENEVFLRMIEVIMEKEDAPSLLLGLLNQQRAK